MSRSRPGHRRLAITPPDARPRVNSRMVPMDACATAGPFVPDEYVVYRYGRWSWSIPYIAGLYALSAQGGSIDHPERFWSTALPLRRTRMKFELALFDLVRIARL